MFLLHISLPLSPKTHILQGYHWWTWRKKQLMPYIWNQKVLSGHFPALVAPSATIRYPAITSVICLGGVAVPGLKREEVGSLPRGGICWVLWPLPADLGEQGMWGGDQWTWTVLSPSPSGSKATSCEVGSGGTLIPWIWIVVGFNVLSLGGMCCFYTVLEQIYLYLSHNLCSKFKAFSTVMSHVNYFSLWSLG